MTSGARTSGSCGENRVEYLRTRNFSGVKREEMRVDGKWMEREKTGGKSHRQVGSEGRDSQWRRRESFLSKMARISCRRNKTDPHLVRESLATLTSSLPTDFSSAPRLFARSRSSSRRSRDLLTSLTILSNRRGNFCSLPEESA